MITRILTAVGMTFAALVSFGCQREPDDLRGELHAMLDAIEEIAREEISILEEVIEQPGRPNLQPVWRDRLSEANSAVARLDTLRADIDGSDDLELAEGIGRRILSDVEEMRRAIEERMRRLREELAGARVVSAAHRFGEQ